MSSRSCSREQDTQQSSLEPLDSAFSSTAPLYASTHKTTQTLQAGAQAKRRFDEKLVCPCRSMPYYPSPSLPAICPKQQGKKNAFANSPQKNNPYLAPPRHAMFFLTPRRLRLLLLRLSRPRKHGNSLHLLESAHRGLRSVLPALARLLVDEH
jgi:hypothetical protein